MTRPQSWLQMKREFVARHPYPGDDPVSRLRHMNAVFADVEDPDSMAVLATSGMYDEGQTGLSYTDLRAIAVELDQLRNALDGIGDLVYRFGLSGDPGAVEDLLLLIHQRAKRAVRPS